MAKEDKELDENVSFIEDGDDVAVDLEGNKPEPKSDKDDERWARAEATQAELRQNIGFLQGQLQGQQNQGSQADPYETELNGIAEQERAGGIQFEALRASGGLNKQLIDEFDRKARALHQRRIDIGTQRAIQAAIPQLVNTQQQQHYRMQYGDVHANPRAVQYAKGRYDQLLAEGEADSPQLVDRAMNDARVRFGMGGARNSGPTDQDKRQMSGVGGGGSRSNATSNVVKMGKPEKSMAMAMYGERFNGDEKKAYAAWAKGPGIRAKKAAEKRSRSGQ